jgi:hypothetical protein
MWVTSVPPTAVELLIGRARHNGRHARCAIFSRSRTAGGGEGAGADHLRERGHRLHHRPPGDRAFGSGSADRGRTAAGCQIGESLRLTGQRSNHVKYGRQFQVHSYTTVLPATIAGIRRYLGSGLIKGIGPMMAERMVTHFGLDTS